MTSELPKILNQTGLVILQVMIIHFMVMVHRFAPILRKWLIHHTTMQERSILQQLAEDACRLVAGKNLGADIPAGSATRPLATHPLDLAVQLAAAIATRKHLSFADDELRTAIEAVWEHASHLSTT